MVYNLCIDDLHSRVAVYEVQNIAQNAFDMAAFIRHCCYSERGSLPQIAIVHFGDRNVETVSEAIFDTLDRKTFRLKGTAFRDEQFNAQNPCNHRWLP